MLTKEQKKKIVKNLSEALSLAKSVVFFDFKGLSVEKLLSLRKDLKKQGITLKIAKKNLIKLAMEKLNGKEFFDAYKGSVALIMDQKGETDGARILKQFKEKEKKDLTILGGILESKFISAKEVLAIADLPSRDILLANLLSLLQGPVRSFVQVIHAPLRDFVQILRNKK